MLLLVNQALYEWSIDSSDHRGPLELVTQWLYSFVRGFGITASLFPGGTLKNTTYTAPGNPVEFKKSEDNFETPEVLPAKFAICIRCLVNGPWV